MSLADTLTNPTGESGSVPYSERGPASIETVASFGFLPMAISTTPGAEIQRPLATVVIGGLITATLLTSLVIPTIYPWFCPRKQLESSL